MSSLTMDHENGHNKRKETDEHNKRKEKEENNRTEGVKKIKISFKDSESTSTNTPTTKDGGRDDIEWLNDKNKYQCKKCKKMFDSLRVGRHGFKCVKGDT